MNTSTMHTMVFGLAVCLAVVGCRDVPSERRAISLDTTLKTYNKLVRWGEFRDAANYLVAREGGERDLDFSEFEGVRITGLELMSQGMADDGLEVRVQNRIHYYRDDSAVLRTVVDNQLWWYDEERKRWFLDGRLPDFK